MKCPYNNFEECIVEECPSCNYETVEHTIVDGRAPTSMSYDYAIEHGLLWETIRKSYEFVSCKLIDNNVRPTQPDIINNNTNIDNRTSLYKKSIF